LGELMSLRVGGIVILILGIAVAAAGIVGIIQGLGLTRYPYERAGSMETFVFLALSLPAV